MFTKVFLLTFHFVSHFGEMLTSRVFFVGGEISHLCEKRKVIATHTMDLLGTKGPKSSDFKAFFKKIARFRQEVPTCQNVWGFHVWRGTQPAISSLAPDWVPKNMAVIVVTQKHRQVHSNRSWRGADDQLPQSLDFDRLKRSFSWHEMVTKLSWIQRVQLLHPFMVEVFFPSLTKCKTKLSSSFEPGELVLEPTSRLISTSIKTRRCTSS